MNDDVPAAAGEDLSSGGTADTSRRSGRAKRSGTFVYPLPSTPLPSSTPLTSTPDPGTHRMSVGMHRRSKVTRPAGWAPAIPRKERPW